MRQVHASGGTAVLIARGDQTAGAILILCAEKGQVTALCERVLSRDGSYRWANTGPENVCDDQAVRDFLSQRLNRDPDLWVVELDIVNAQRFIAEFAPSA